MTQTDLTNLTLPDLLELHAAILSELRRRNVSRTENNPTGSYAEHLVEQKLGFRLEGNSESGYDAADAKGIRYQVKGRRVTPNNRSTQLSAIRNLAESKFQFLLGILFDEKYLVVKAIKIPHSVVKEYATFQEHTHSHRLCLTKKLLADSRTEDLTARFAN